MTYLIKLYNGKELIEEIDWLYNKVVDIDHIIKYNNFDYRVEQVIHYVDKDILVCKRIKHEQIPK